MENASCLGNIGLIIKRSRKKEVNFGQNLKMAQILETHSVHKRGGGVKSSNTAAAAELGQKLAPPMFSACASIDRHFIEKLKMKICNQHNHNHQHHLHNHHHHHLKFFTVHQLIDTSIIG